MKNIFKILIIIFSFYVKLQTVYAQAGTLDPTFGNGGLLVQPTVNGNEMSIMQPDGKIIIVGSNIGASFDRFNPDGSYDQSFGTNGRLNITLNGKLSGPQFKTFALLEDGKIICAALYLQKPTSKMSVGIIRVNPNGTQDSSFGNNGLDTLELDNTTRVTGLVVQPDGKIVISGDVQRNEYDEKRTFISRLMPDGGLDPTFGEGGTVITTYTNATNSNSLMINSAGKLIRGSTYNKYNEHAAYMLECFDTNGNKDISFGENGAAKYIFGEGQSGDWYNIMEGAIMQTDNKIVCFGESGKDYIEMAICRFNSNGTIDENFGENGSSIVPYRDHQFVGVLGIDIQADGKILIGGGGGEPFLNLVLVRYLINGQLDPNFGDNGIVSIVNDTASMGASSVHSLPDGKILTTGRISPIGPDAYTLLARFKGDNVLATHFKNVKAVENKEGISISWQTLNESNTQSYTVERSGNAQDYRDIANIPAKGQTENSYNYTDKNPLAGDNYYRIRENARNGTVSYSQTLKVNFIQSGVLSLYPNPAKSTVTVKGLDKNSASVIKIMDMQGREISSQHFDRVSTATLNIRSLAQGAYFVQITQGEKVVRLKMVKE